MEFLFSKKRISMTKVMSDLDKFVFDFCEILEKEEIRYVVVSGYVAIVFGRSRNTEDIDILVEKLDFGRFEKLWKSLSWRYECQNTRSVKDAYHDYLMEHSAIRFSKGKAYVPNFEFKFVKSDIDKYTLDNRIELKVDRKRIYISQLELQIAYKLKLGSDKDIDDAIFLYELFKERIDKRRLDGWIADLTVPIEVLKQFKGEI